MAAIRSRLAAIGLWLALAAVAGCTSYSRDAPLIREALTRDDYAGALAQIEKIDKSGSELLYCYEKGLVLHEQGDYAGSNQAFERAEQVLEELYTKSISREVGAIIVSETISKYRGDPFEAVLVNYYKILNYLFLDDVDGALVECRRLNGKLQMIHDAGETYFEDDPFLQYLTGLVYELGGEAGSAEVSYRAAVQEYGRGTSAPPAPPWLACDATANARALGDSQAADSLFSPLCDSIPAGEARLAVLVEYGAVARKIETGFVVPIFESDRWDNNDEFSRELSRRRQVEYHHPPHVKYWLKVALPALQVDPPDGLRAVVRVVAKNANRADAPAEAGLARVEDLDTQAARAFAEKEPTILLRAIARALAKYIASNAADNKNEGLGALVNLLGIMTETADTRSWTTLPRSIDLARLDVEPGLYRIDVDVLDAAGRRIARRTFDDVDVRRGGLAVRRVRVR